MQVGGQWITKHSHSPYSSLCLGDMFTGSYSWNKWVNIWSMNPWERVYLDFQRTSEEHGGSYEAIRLINTQGIWLCAFFEIHFLFNSLNEFDLRCCCHFSFSQRCRIEPLVLLSADSIVVIFTYGHRGQWSDGHFYVHVNLLKKHHILCLSHNSLGLVEQDLKLLPLISDLLQSPFRFRFIFETPVIKHKSNRKSDIITSQIDNNCTIWQEENYKYVTCYNPSMSGFKNSMTKDAKM